MNYKLNIKTKMPKYKLTQQSTDWIIDGVLYKKGDVIELTKEKYEHFQNEKNKIDLIEIKEEKKETKQ